MDGRALLGRERELVEIDAALTRLHDGERVVLMLTGEPGIGKTRLLEEIASRARARKTTVAWGRTWEVGLTPAFWPWMKLLAALEQSDDPSPKLGSLDQRADNDRRLALFAEVSAFLARRAPAVLLFDDLHAADPSSLQLLEYVVPALAGEALLVAMSARDGDATPAVATALGRIQRGARRLPLARLGRDDVGVLVADRANVERVFELSEGNPLFVEELVASGDLRLPQVSGVRAVIRDRIAKLPEATATALSAAAVVGREFRGLVVADMLGVDGDAIDTRLAPALRLGMLAMTGPDRHRFSHALVAEAMADELEPSERARLHLRAAQAIERREGVAGSASAVAHHLLAAGHLAAGAAVGAAERAAADAMSQLAFEDAAAMYERGIQALALAAPDDLARRARLLCGQIEALQHATQHPRATELCDQAVTIARSLGDGELLARIALARGLEMRFGRTDPVLVEALKEALEKLGPDQPGLRARLLARLAAAEQPALDARGPLARAFEAIELARQLPDRDRLEVTYTATSALIDYVAPDVLEPIHQEVLGLARALGERVIVAHTYLRLCFTAMERLDRGAVQVALSALSAQATSLGLPRWIRHVHMMEAMIALLEGRFADAERAADLVEGISNAIGDTNAKFIVDVHRAMATWTRTAPPDEALERAVGIYVPGRVAISSWFAAQRGDVAATRRALAPLGDLPTDPDMAALLASAVAFAGTPAQIAVCYDAMSRQRGRIALTSMVGFAVIDLTDRLLLLLATAAGRWDAVDGHARDALAVAEKLGSPAWIARVRADWADALDRRAGKDDVAHARELRALALADAERLQMPGLIERCRAARPPAPIAARVSTKGIALDRRGELWIVTGFGEELHVKDSRGMQMLSVLIAEPGRERHALDLVSEGGPIDRGDGGEALDAKARAAYRARRAELVAQRDEAEAHGDLGRAARIAEELEALTGELERAVGLGGRDRKVGAATERARSNVQRRVQHAIQQIRSGSRRLGDHLVASIRTGTYCVYEPRG